MNGEKSRKTKAPSGRRKKETRRYHHGTLRETLISAGRNLLELRGRHGFTLRECARRARVSHAAPAHHFRTVGDLLAEIVARGFDELSTAMDAAAAETADRSDPAQRLAAFGRGYVRFALANKAVFQLMFDDDVGLEKTDHLATAAKAAHARLTDGIDKLVPQSSPAARRELADLAWASVHGFAMLLLSRQLDLTGPADSVFNDRLNSLLHRVVAAIASR